ncbi:MAG: leucine dehydrogenase [Acidimicrobiia bacterium]|nr:MAG: leucine dehydrogenase [Acidimicrobiia bacterium]
MAEVFRTMTEGHEGVYFAADPESGLRAIIAVHSTRLGPALGGTRFLRYPTEQAALTDALDLAAAMTYKAAAAGLELGGGKAVIMADPSTAKTPELLAAYGRAVNALGGRYITAEDVGTTVDDMVVVHTTTPHVAGLPLDLGGSGDPSPATAAGVFAAMRAVAQHLWESPDLSGRRIAVQGVGKVGSALVRILVEEGCDVVVGDVASEATAAVVASHDVAVLPPDEVITAECDILAPCALGGVLREESIPLLGCGAVVGSANNQLRSKPLAEAIRARGITYAPDFVVNAGGIINISEEVGGYSNASALREVSKIEQTLTEILQSASEAGTTPLQAAIARANERLNHSPQPDEPVLETRV